MNTPLTDRVDALLAGQPEHPTRPRSFAWQALGLLRELRDAHKAVSGELVAALARCHAYQAQIADAATPRDPWGLLEDALKRADLVLFYDNDLRCLRVISTTTQPATRELAANIRRNLRHLAHEFRGSMHESVVCDYVNHMDTLAQQIEGESE